MIQQGDVFWIDLGPPSGPGFLHPYVVGTLSMERIQQILDGIYLLLEPREIP